MVRKSKSELERALDDVERAESDTLDSPSEAYAALLAAACGDATHPQAELERALNRWPAVREEQT